jgi:hypothetical protein
MPSLREDKRKYHVALRTRLPIIVCDAGQRAVFLAGVPFSSSE